MHGFMGIELYSKAYFVILFGLMVLWTFCLAKLIVVLSDLDDID